MKIITLAKKYILCTQFNILVEMKSSVRESFVLIDLILSNRSDH